jgi:hypothetical protein
MFFLTHDSVACIIDTIAWHKKPVENDHEIRRCREHLRAIVGKALGVPLSSSHSSHIPT